MDDVNKHSSKFVYKANWKTLSQLLQFVSNFVTCQCNASRNPKVMRRFGRSLILINCSVQRILQDLRASFFSIFFKFYIFSYIFGTFIYVFFKNNVPMSLPCLCSGCCQSNHRTQWGGTFSIHLGIGRSIPHNGQTLMKKASFSL